jgi:hypothetical protein
MNSAFPARFPLKVLYRIRNVNLASINSGFFKRPVHDLSCRPDERFAGDIFVIARLFPDQHHRCVPQPFPKHSLGGAFVKVTCGATARSFPQLH